MRVDTKTPFEAKRRVKGIVRDIKRKRGRVGGKLGLGKKEDVWFRVMEVVLHRGEIRREAANVAEVNN